MEKVVRYKGVSGDLHETLEGALMDEFSCDHRAQRIAAAVSCGSEALLRSLWTNRKAVLALIEDMEIVLNEQENQ